MARGGLRVRVIVCFVAATTMLWRAQSRAIPLDADGDIKLGVRTYVNVRIGTETTHDGVILGPGTPDQTSTSATFPHSDAGHMRQNRAYIEAELNHDLARLVRQGVGPLSLLKELPFKIKGLGYHLTFRGEADSLYDWGPNEYSTAGQFYKVQASAPSVLKGQLQVPVSGTRERLRHYGTDRERLFQAYGELNVGSLFTRFGRQILSWGETDGFQLLDHINPIDSSFGGFLISLDERRVPLDMILTNYNLGDFGPFQDAYLESYAAIDNKVGYYPGTPAGSPWALPSLGAPSNNTQSFAIAPARTFQNVRGGFLLKFNALDATFSLAHYYTFFDTPNVQVVTPPGGIGRTFNDGQPCANDPTKTNCGYPTRAYQSAPKVQITGGSTTFAVPQFYSVVRSEFAYFRGEPGFTQGQLDPFLFFTKPNGMRGGTTGGVHTRDSINAVVGLDINQWIRALNPNQTFFISTQFFFKRIMDAAGNKIYLPDGTLNPNREVLPPQLNVLAVNAHNAPLQGSRLEPLFIRQPQNQYLQTLFIGSSYRSGTINPGLTLFYDWGGAFLYQPTITFVHDPFRFIVDYSILSSHIYKGGSGVSLLQDRDNVQFRFEYVI
jgi:hypothetical protein